MPNNNTRASIFAPFDALKGFKEEIKKKEKVVVEKRILSVDSEEDIARKLNLVQVGNMIELVFYSDSNYLKIKGLVSKINIDEKYLVVVKDKIYFKDIVELNN